MQRQSDLQRLQYEYEKELRQMRGMAADHIYQQSYDTMVYRSSSDIKEIERLKKELEYKKVKRSNEIKDLIAYYYKR